MASNRLTKLQTAGDTLRRIRDQLRACYERLVSARHQNDPCQEELSQEYSALRLLYEVAYRRFSRAFASFAANP